MPRLVGLSRGSCWRWVCVWPATGVMDASAVLLNEGDSYRQCCGTKLCNETTCALHVVHFNSCHSRPRLAAIATELENLTLNADAFRVCVQARGCVSRQGTLTLRSRG